MSQRYRVAVVGATGVVGQTVLRVLEEYEDRFPVGELIPFASERSEGQSVSFGGQELSCRVLTPEAVAGFDLVFSSAGSDISRDWAERFATHGALVIDKSSAFRKNPDVPLVVPEVNPNDVCRALEPSGKRIIATPNCSTTQLVVTLNPLLKACRIRRLVISTYQAVSGTGARAVEELEGQARAVLANEDVPPPRMYPHQIAFNALAQAGSFVTGAEGRTDEEEKLRNETREILHQDEIAISATCVRVPVKTCHSEAVNIEFESQVTPEEARRLLEEAKGVTVLDDIDATAYPSAIQAEGRDDVFVGRIRRDPGCDRALDLWIVADNLRKGAATNAVQIAELLHERSLIGAPAKEVAAPEPLPA